MPTVAFPTPTGPYGMSPSLPAPVHVHRPGLFLDCRSEHVLGYSLIKDVSSSVMASLRNNDL